MIMYKPNKIKGINRYILESRQKTNAVLVPADGKLVYVLSSNT